MRPVDKIIANNKEILYLNFSGLRTKEEIFKQVEIFGRHIRNQPFKSVITITNIDNMYFNTDIYNYFTAYVKANNPYVKESVVIGMKGLMQIFYKGFIALTGRNVKVCDNLTEAIMNVANTTTYRFEKERSTQMSDQH